ncbi:MAG: alpha/beta fold hydrolase, partial [Amylibacter sp.]
MPSVKLSAAEISYLDEAASNQGHENGGEYPILLVHGFSSSIKDNWFDTLWIKFLNDLGLRVIAFDNRGHGHSEKFYSEGDYSLDAMAGDATDLLDHLEIDKAHI